MKTETAIWKLTKLHFDGGFKICSETIEVFRVTNIYFKFYFFLKE